MEIIDYRRGDAKGGILVNGKDQYIAVTESTSKKFKSLRGAQKFMESYGYRPVKENKTTSIGGTRYRSDERNSRAEVYPGGQDEYGRDLFRVELREDNGHVEELYMTKTKLNRWLDQFGFKPDRQVGQARKSKGSPLRYIVTNPKHYNYGRTIEIYPEEKDEHGFILVRIYENGNLIKEQYDPESHLDIQTDNQYSYIRKDKPSKYTRSKIRFGVLVSFHSTNRGLKFEGEKPFSQIMSEQSAYLYTDDNGITRDDTGRIVSEDDPNGDTGELEFERSDRYYTKRVYEYGDLSDYEIDAIKKYRYISDDLKDIID